MTATVMVVEDDPHLCDLPIAFVEKYDCGARGAHTGQEALALFEQLRPELVILDLNLPDLDGLQLLKTFKRVDPHCKSSVADVTSNWNLSPSPPSHKPLRSES